MDGVSTVMRTVPALKDAPPGGNAVRAQASGVRVLHRSYATPLPFQAQQEEAAKRRRVAAAAAASKENQVPA